MYAVGLAILRFLEQLQKSRNAESFNTNRLQEQYNLA